MKATPIFSVGLFIALLGCKPPQAYEWGSYEGALYKLMKEPAGLEKYGATLLDVIKTGEEKNKVPPGLYAEYGYFLFVSNKHSEAKSYFEKEKLRWPESAKLMDKMIQNCGLSKSSQAGTTPLIPSVSESSKDSK